MTETMKCLACTADIEKDSCYCDQCGKEIFLCTSCLEPGDQRFCIFDGNEMIPAKQRFGMADDTVVADHIVKLKLTNQNIGLSLDIAPDAILGRNTGPYANILQGYSAISGKHLIFKYTYGNGWTFEDLGSTNGTKYHVSSGQWDQVKRCEPNTPVNMADRAFLLIANIELSIEIEHASPQTAAPVAGATQRI